MTNSSLGGVIAGAIGSFGAVAIALGACAVASPSQESTPRATVYAPSVSAGRKGRAMVWSAAARPVVHAGVRQPSLENPDPKPVAATRAWLTGTWLLLATADDLDRAACSSDRPVAYKGDGTLRFAEGQGTWSLRGSTLVETITLAYESAGSGLSGEVGRPTRITIKRVGPDEGAMLADDSWLPMLRCRPGDLM